MDTEMVIVRHGETVWNRELRVQGYRDSALTDDGISQARALAARLSSESFHALLSSDLGRAVQTADIISERTGHEVRIDQKLRERNYGVLEGLTRDEFRVLHPVAAEHHDSRDAEYVIFGGESQREFVSRIVAVFDAIADEFRGRRIVVVSHGGVLAALHRHISGVPIGAPRTLPLPNASYNILARRDGKWIVERWGDTGHLVQQDVFGEV
jgi:2,3-bisphosphoglycerate-dependent phosphoglycerate mutase